MPIDWSKLYAGGKYIGGQRPSGGGKLPNPNDYPQTYGGATAYAWAYFQAGGTASQVTFAGQSFMRSDAAPGGVLYNLFNGGGGGTGAGGGAAGPGATPAQMAAVNASQPTITGGGAGFSIGAVDNNTVMTAWPGEWEGIDTLSPDTKIPESLSPEATNWNGLERFGSRCVRRGMVKMSEDRSSVTISASAIHADYRGVSIVPIANADYMLMCMADNDGTIGAALTAQPISLWILTTFPLWGRPVDLRTYPGPKLALTEPSPGTIRVTYDYTNVWSSAAIQKISCKSISIRYNLGAGDITFPLELDTITDDDTTGRRAGTAARDRTTWDGTSATVDIITGLSSGGVCYVSAWAHSLLGTSERSTAARAIA